MKQLLYFPLFLPLIALTTIHPLAAEAQPKPAPGDKMIAEYFKRETAVLAERCLDEIKTLDEWNAKKAQYRQQLFEMLSLSPLPSRTDLKPVTTGRIEHEFCTVENLHFQSLPGLYVTANLYLPKKVEKRVPAILYVAGHARVVTNGVSFGNKTAYQHHGIWFARNGYACLIIDTVQLGEIQGIHHGTHREGMWWWNARGYTSAGVEAWNSIRALDYLQSRPEVDGERIGVTGRSGGGAYSWWVTALDDRIKAAAPVAGITDLRNHVVDGVVEGHCDCMFIVNTHRWDYAQVAALAAPRPLLICNSDKDSIFPLDGVIRVHAQVRRIYELHKARDKLGLLITEGPHKDTQELQLPVFRWFNRFLKGEEPVIEMAAVKLFQPQELKVFQTLPADERTSKIHETFVAPAEIAGAPDSAADWIQARQEWMKDLKEKVFAGWPEQPEPLNLEFIRSARSSGAQWQTYEFDSQAGIRLRLDLLHSGDLKNTESVELQVEQNWKNWPTQVTFKIPGRDWIKDLRDNRQVIAYVTPRGIGPTAWDPAERKQIQIRRRFMLLGQTLDGMRVWDIRRAVQAIRSLDELKTKPLTLAAGGSMGVNALYASLFEPDITSLTLSNLPRSHREGPDYLNVMRFLDIPQAAAMAAERSKVILLQSGPSGWEYPAGVAAHLGWQDRFSVSGNTPGN